ncbi:phosphotransferase [Frigidibacter sp. MR17.14]|uniref:phosphotransferase family protein n=1 Tax=Frigidibacter sp. MR17.14 TaxID=3126509 RepID=UPI003012D956
MSGGRITGALVSDAALAVCLAGARPDLAAAPAVAGPAALASPSYLALESRSLRIDAPEGPLFLKVMHPEMRTGFDLTAAMALATAAGAEGIAPEVLWSDAAEGAILMRDPGTAWTAARQSHLQDPAVVGAVLAALRRLHALPALGTRFDAFAQIDALLDRARASGVALPQDIGWVMALLEPLRAPLAAAPTVPCRNDGSASNLLVGPDAAVLLVDFDRAGQNDPMYDLGVLLAEITDFEADMIAPAAAYMGAFEPAGFARARLWSIVDDVMHCLWARVSGVGSVRGAVEWLKYSEWRIMRARLGLRHPQFEEKVRSAGGQA